MNLFFYFLLSLSLNVFIQTREVILGNIKERLRMQKKESHVFKI